MRAMLAIALLSAGPAWTGKSKEKSLTKIRPQGMGGLGIGSGTNPCKKNVFLQTHNKKTVYGSSLKGKEDLRMKIHLEECNFYRGTKVSTLTYKTHHRITTRV